MVKIAAIILNWNQPELTKATIESLLKVKTTGISLIIYLIDNNSKPEVQKILRRYASLHKNIKYLQTGGNFGYAGGNNFGIKAALKDNSDYLLVANNDLIFDSDFLVNLYRASSQNPKAGILGPKIYFAPGFEFHASRYQKKDKGRVIWSVGGSLDWNNILGSNIGVDEVDIGQYDQISYPEFISGCCFLSPAKVFLDVGLFDDKYFMYFEDVDFSHRVKKSGFDITYIPTSKIWHVNSGSSASGSTLHDYFITRNRLLFGLKYAGPKTKFALIRESFRFLLKGRPPQKQAVLDYYFRKLGKGRWLKN